MKKKPSTKDPYTRQTEGGYPCNDAGYSSLDMAIALSKKTKEQALEYIHNQIDKLFPKEEVATGYKNMLERLVHCVSHVFRKLPMEGTPQDQLRLLQVFYNLFMLYYVPQEIVKKVWPVLQYYLCLRAEIKLKGIQGYKDYFDE